MNSTPTILLQHSPNEDISNVKSAVEKIAPHFQVWTANNSDRLDEERLKSVEIAAGQRFHPSFEVSKNLKWYHHNAAGLDWIYQYKNRINFEFEITNISGLHAPQITEHVFGLIHSLSRDTTQFSNNQERHRWQRPREDRIFNLPGKTILIIGLGAVGSRIAKIAKAHDMLTIGIRRSPKKTDINVDSMHSISELSKLLPRSDIIVSILPGTPDTVDLFNQTRFQQMKKKSLFINVGRGSHVVEDALMTALTSQHLAGAGLDVFQNEPLPENSPLWDTPNLIISPHCSGTISNYIEKAYEYFLDNLKRYLNNLPLKNRIDKNLGY